jgi:hypothetical protein
MSARKLAALVIKLVFLYLGVTSFFYMLASFATLPFAGEEYTGYRLLGAIATLCFTFIYFVFLVCGDRLARWIVREDWSIESGENAGAAFWSRTVPVLMVMGTGILVLGDSTSGLISDIPTFVVFLEKDSQDNLFLYPLPEIMKTIAGHLLSLAFGAYLFLRPGGLLQLFRRYGQTD